MKVYRDDHNLLDCCTFAVEAVNDALNVRTHTHLAEKITTRWIYQKWCCNIADCISTVLVLTVFAVLCLLHCQVHVFSALTLLVGWQEGHLACKNWVIVCW